MGDKSLARRIEWKKLSDILRNLCKRKDRLFILLLTGILLLVIAVPIPKKAENQKQSTSFSEQNTTGIQDYEAEEYAEYLEQKLSAVLSEVKGVGRTEVMITMASSAEKILGADQESESESIKEEDSQGGTRSTVQNKNSQTTVYENGADRQGTPYVTKELTPEVSGVIVIAEGGNDPVAVQNIIEAVQALFEIDTHKIKVMKRN